MNHEIETIRMKPAETVKVELVSRGALGLQLFCKMDIDTIVEVNRLEPAVIQSSTIRAGDPMEAIFEIKSLQSGTVTITFYESQPWNKEFKEIVQKVIKVVVTD